MNKVDTALGSGCAYPVNYEHFKINKIKHFRYPFVIYFDS